MSNLCPPDSLLNQDPQAGALWEKICRLSFDRGTGPRTFAVRLAGEQGWSASFAVLAIGEYRRFLLLFALDKRGAPEAAGHPVVRIVPSPVIDEVWHLHLLYTQSYWEDLCRDILDGPLHHLPADGSGGEGAALDAVYRHTLDAYRRTFGQEAPEAVWPGANRPAQAVPQARRAPGKMTVAFGAIIVPNLIIAWMVMGNTFWPVLFCVAVMAATLFSLVRGDRQRSPGAHRRTRLANGSADSGGVMMFGGDASGDTGSPAHHDTGHHGGSHDAGGHSHACGGGHSCGGHGCGGH